MLDLLVDSTGIKFLGEGEWKRKKHGAEYRRQWRKVHLGIDAHTLEIRAIEVADNSVEDGAGSAPMTPWLLAQIPPDEAVASISGDEAYDIKACRRLEYAIWKKWSGYHLRSLGDDQDAWLQALGRAGHGTHA